MSAKSAMEDVLVMMLWAGDKLVQPTLRNLTEPFEAWERRQGFPRQLQRMEQRRLLVRETRASQMVYRLTELGRLQALGGKDAGQRWARPWDGRWRQVLFDLPVNLQRVRLRLWRWLRDNGFGYLQQSVWIHPDPLPSLMPVLAKFRDDVESLILMEATCCAGYSNAAVVNGAWDFAAINQRYEGYLAMLKPLPQELHRLTTHPAALTAWLRRERLAWQHALAIDPLLPRDLWPTRYCGPEAWRMRQACYRKLSEQLVPA